MKTSRWLLFPLLSLTAIAAEPVVSIAGIQAVHDDGEKEFNGFKTYNSDKGLGVTLIIRSDKAIVGFDDDNAVLTIGGAKAKSHFFGDMAYAKDRKTVRLEFDAQGAAQVGADGKLKVAGE